MNKFFYLHKRKTDAGTRCYYFILLWKVCIYVIVKPKNEHRRFSFGIYIKKLWR